LYKFLCLWKSFSESDYTNHLQERLKYQTVPKPANTSQLILPNDEALLRPSCSHIDNSTFSHHAPSSNTTDVNITISTLSSDITDINSTQQCSSKTGDGLLLTSTDHDYCKIDSQSVSKSSTTIDHSDKYSFLLENRRGILNKVGIGKNDLTPQKSEMYQIHLNVQSKLSKLRNLFKRERAHLTSVKNLYNDGRFEFIVQNLN
jgi:hypothetical protein